jgi:hypothetical protein
LVKAVVYFFEFVPDTFDMGIDRPVIDIDILTICHINQLVSRPYMPGPRHKRLDQKKLRDRKVDGPFLPGAQMPGLIQFYVPINNMIVLTPVGFF